MLGRRIKFLTLCLCSMVVFAAHGKFSLEQIDLKTHLRWVIRSPKSQIKITKHLDEITFETLNREAFESLKQGINGKPLNQKYLRRVESFSESYPEEPYKIKITMMKNGVEVFDFYKEQEKEFVIDFWKDETSTKISAIEKKRKSIVPEKASTKKPNIKSRTKKKSKKIAKNKSADKRIKKEAIPTANKSYRDFRYGASLVWDYPPVIPKVSKTVNLSSKTPEYFYPVADVEYKADDRQAHMQLIINLYRKKKWGLMYKGMKLYEKKYGELEEKDTNFELMDYLKANSVIRKNLFNLDKGPMKMAMNMLSNIADRTNNYQFKIGILKYLIQYHLDNKNYVDSLSFAKRLYVETMNNFDREISEYAAIIMMQNLAQLSQVERLEEFTNEPTVKKLVAKQDRITYKVYLLVKKNSNKEAINYFERVEKGLAEPVNPSILYNIAEAYFRDAQYEKSIKYFDKFLATASHLVQAPFARNRLALSYEILEKNINETIALYENAINRGTNSNSRYEAKIRYVGIINARKYKQTEKDLEKLIFLERKPSEERSLTSDIKRLLWLVRLRTLTNQRKFDDALAYLKAIPLDTLKPSEKRLFESEGAEIVFGLIDSLFKKGEYAKAIKIWEIYKEDYPKKVANDPYANYMTAYSYLNLGLMNTFQKILKDLNTIKNAPNRSFPIWVERDVSTNGRTLARELSLVKEMKTSSWDNILDKTENIEKAKDHYYRGVAFYKKNQFAEAVKSIEKFLVKKGAVNKLSYFEMSQFFNAYTESLYRDNKLGRFKEVSQALIKDMAKISAESKDLARLTERLKYLTIEILNGENTDRAFLEVEMLARDFNKEFKESAYQKRIDYLLGVSLVKNKKKTEGVKVFRNLLNDIKTPDYIKELCRSELSAIQIEEQQL